MECRIDYETVELYVDGELSGEELTRVEEALVACPESRRRVEFQRRLKGLVVNSEEPVTVPDLARKRLLKALDTEAERLTNERIEAGVDGELDTQEKALLQDTPEIRRRIEFQRRLKEMVRQTGLSERTPADVRYGVVTRLQQGDQVFDLVEAYVDDDLDAEEHELFAALAEEDPELESQVAFQRQFKEMLASAATGEKTPAGVRERLLKALRAEAATHQPEGAPSETVEAYVDGELEGVDLARFEAHLAECQETQRQVAFACGLKDAVSQAAGEEKTPDLVRRRIMKALEAEAPPQKRRQPTAWARPLLAAASLVLVSVLAFAGLQKSTTSPLVAALANDHVNCGRVDRALFPDLDPVEASRDKIGVTPVLASLPANLTHFDTRMCPFPDNRVAMHVLYHDADRDGALVSFYGIPDDSAFKLNLQEVDHSIDPRIASHDTVNMALWKHQGWVYSLVAELPSDQVRSLATGSNYSAFLEGATALIAMLDF